VLLQTAMEGALAATVIVVCLTGDRVISSFTLETFF
jgi:hypothetical protein